MWRGKRKRRKATMVTVILEWKWAGRTISHRRRKTKKYLPDNQHELPVRDRRMLQALQHKTRYTSQLQEKNGKRLSPQTRNRSSITIDKLDQFTPDNWLPRCPDLIRLTGKHPINAEPSLKRLFDGGLITPNELHYVRNHGPVP